MVEDEKNRLKGQAVDQYQSLCEEAAILRCKSGNHLKAIVDAVGLLKGKETGHYKVGRLFIGRQPHSAIVREVKWPSCEELGNHINEVNDTNSRIQEAESQLRDLGLGDFVKSPGNAE